VIGLHSKAVLRFCGTSAARGQRDTAHEAVGAIAYVESMEKAFEGADVVHPKS
jgi:hypothetical protein